MFLNQNKVFSYFDPFKYMLTNVEGSTARCHNDYASAPSNVVLEEDLAATTKLPLHTIVTSCNQFKGKI